MARKHPSPPPAPEPDLFSGLDLPEQAASKFIPQDASKPPGLRSQSGPSTPKKATSRGRVPVTLSLSQVLAKLPPGAALAEVAVEGVVRGSFTYLVDERVPEPRLPGMRVQVPF